MKYFAGKSLQQEEDSRLRDDVVQNSSVVYQQYLIGKLPKKINNQVKMDNLGYEKLILLSLKNDNCGYFPKYYYTRQDNFTFSNYFLIERIQRLTLYEET